MLRQEPDNLPSPTGKFHPQPALVQHPPTRLVCSYEISVGAAVSAARAAARTHATLPERG